MFYKLIVVLLLFTNLAHSIVINVNEKTYLRLDKSQLLMSIVSEDISNPILKEKRYNWFRPSTLNFGYGVKARLLKFKIISDSKQFAIKYSYPMMQNVKMWAYKGESLISFASGGKSSPNNRSKDVVLIGNAVGEVDIYLYLKSTSAMQMPVFVGSFFKVEESIINENFIYGLVFGGVLSLILYNLFMYIASRELLYIYFAFYGFSVFIINFAFTGLFYQYFYFFPAYLKSRIVVLAISVMLIFLSLFTKSYFSVEASRMPFINKILNFCIGVSTILFVLNLVFYNSISISLNGLLGILLPLTILFVGLYMLIFKKNSSLLFVTGTGSVLIGFITYCLKDFALLPNNSVTVNSFLYSSLVEMVLLGYGIARRFKYLQSQNQILHEQTIISEQDKLYSKLSRQVAHDIRSPLAALDMILVDDSELNEEKKVIIRSAVGRITDIANDLLVKFNHSRTVESSKPQRRSVLISTLIESIVSEKRVSLRNNGKISITFSLGQDSYGVFSYIDSASFKRSISNIINNSVESFKELEGQIEVLLLSPNEDIAEIKITDNGVGIPPEILEKIGKEGVTFGKNNGSGLGLYSSIQIIENTGGKLSVYSKNGKGTTVTIRIPKTIAPNTFVSSLVIKENSKIVVVDDDQSIHNVWKKRFRGMFVKIIHLHSPNEFLEWNNNNEADLYLVDYEYSNSQLTGIDLARAKQHRDNFFLVTSRFEEESIVNLCSSMKIKMIPKSLAIYLPIRT